MAGPCKIREAVLQGKVIQPIRHMQIMAVVARCRFCQKCCCCSDHRKAHEQSDHSAGSDESTLVQCNQKKRLKVADLTESSLAEYVSDGDFPVHCLYCQMVFASRTDLQELLKWNNKPCLPYIPDRCHLLVRRPKELQPTPNVTLGSIKDINNVHLKRKLTVIFGMDSSSVEFKSPFPLAETPLPVVTQSDQKDSSKPLVKKGGISTSTPAPCPDYLHKTSRLFVKGSISAQDVMSPLATALISPIEEKEFSDSVYVDMPSLTPNLGNKKVVEDTKGYAESSSSERKLKGISQRKVKFAEDSSDSENIPPCTGDEKLENSSENDMSIEVSSNQYKVSNAVDCSEVHLDSSSVEFKSPFPLAETLLPVVTQSDQKDSSKLLVKKGGISTSTPCPDYLHKTSRLFVKGSISAQDVMSPLATALVSPIEEKEFSDSVYVDMPSLTPQLGNKEVVEDTKGYAESSSSDRKLKGISQRKVTFAEDGSDSEDIPPCTGDEKLENSSESDMSIEVSSNQHKVSNAVDCSEVASNSSKSIQSLSSEGENDHMDTVCNSPTIWEQEGSSEGKSHFNKLVDVLSSAWQSALAGIKSTSEKWMRNRRVRSPSSSPQAVFYFGEHHLSNKKLRLSSPSPSEKLLGYPRHRSTSERRYAGGPLRYISARPPISRMRHKH